MSKSPANIALNTNDTYTVPNDSYLIADLFLTTPNSPPISVILTVSGPSVKHGSCVQTFFFPQLLSGGVPTPIDKRPIVLGPGDTIATSSASGTVTLWLSGFLYPTAEG